MTLLPEVQHALLEGVRRDQVRVRTSRFARLRARRVWMPVSVLAALLGSTTVALAAGGVILTGSPVRTPGHGAARVAFGIPAPGESRLLPIRAQDPAGGLPWGMRVIHTTRGYVCVQVGRVDHGRLGELGIDGAFHNDGHFHPLPVNALPDVVSPGQAFDIDCALSSQNTFAGSLRGIQSSAAGNPPRNKGALSARRDISYGLLGPHATQITYQTTTGAKESAKPLRGLGAYLIVQPATSRAELGSIGDTFGGEGGPTKPNGALRAISYRYGSRTCTSDGQELPSVWAACGLQTGPPAKPKPLPAVNEPIGVHLTIRHHVLHSAYITFKAPYPVTSVKQDYTTSLFGCPNPHSENDGGSLRRDVLKGAQARIALDATLLFACHKHVTLQLDYLRLPNHGVPGTTTVGTTTISLPPGDRPAPVPPSLRESLQIREERWKRHH